MADLDDDGVWEVVAGGSAGASVTRAGTIMDGYPVAIGADVPGIGDVDRDGRLDILFIGSSNGELNCLTLGQNTYKSTKFLTNGHQEAFGGQSFRTGSLDPFEPNDKWNAPFVAGPGTTIGQSRAFRVRSFNDTFNSSSGMIRQLRAIVGTSGDHDFYRASGTRIRVDLQTQVGPADLDLKLHVYLASSGAFLKSYSSTGSGTESLDCDWQNPCPELGAGSKDFLIEVIGKDPAKDYGPWPYALTIYGAQ